jgi:hypothetical protein
MSEVERWTATVGYKLNGEIKRIRIHMDNNRMRGGDANYMRNFSLDNNWMVKGGTKKITNDI